MIALKLCGIVHMLGRYSFLAGSIYKYNLNVVLFYNLKPVIMYGACVVEHNVTQDRALFKDPRKSLIIN
jgi:hypothetical protein